MDFGGTSWILNGVTYCYDGSIADFRRAEQGLPPLAYEEAVAAQSNNIQSGNKQILPEGGSMGGGVITEAKGVQTKTDKITYIPPDEVKDMYKRTNSYVENAVSTGVALYDMYKGSAATGITILFFEVTLELKDEAQYRYLCSAIEQAVSNGNGLVVLQHPYVDDPRAAAGNGLSCDWYVEWDGQFGKYPYAVNPY